MEDSYVAGQDLLLLIIYTCPIYLLTIRHVPTSVNVMPQYA